MAEDKDAALGRLQAELSELKRLRDFFANNPKWSKAAKEEAAAKIDSDIRTKKSEIERLKPTD